MWAVAKEGIATKTVRELVWTEKLESATSPAQAVGGSRKEVTTSNIVRRQGRIIAAL